MRKAEPQGFAFCASRDLAAAGAGVQLVHSSLVMPFPCSTVRILSSDCGLIFSMAPPGQWTSISSMTVGASPSPKCTRKSLEEAKLPPLMTSLR